MVLLGAFCGLCRLFAVVFFKLKFFYSSVPSATCDTGNPVHWFILRFSMTSFPFPYANTSRRKSMIIEPARMKIKMHIYLRVYNLVPSITPIYSPGITPTTYDEFLQKKFPIFLTLKTSLQDEHFRRKKRPRNQIVKKCILWFAHSGHVIFILFS